MFKYFAVAGIIILILIMANHPIFGGTIKGKRLERIKKSPNYKDGVFQNLSLTPSLAEGFTMRQVLWEFITDKTENKKPKNLIPTHKTDLKNQSITDNFLVWMGHSSYYFQLSGKRFLVDPVFSGNASPIPGTTKAFAGTDIYSAEDFPEIDFLIISHDHYDHLDYKTIKELKPKIKTVICGLGVGAHFERWGFDENQIIELDWYDSRNLVNIFKITSTPARHFSGRLFKRNTTLWSSFVLETPSKKIFLGGDSGYDFHFKQIGEKFGPFDWAILENGQYNEKWKYIHTLPDEFGTVVNDLNAKNIFPVHSVKFALAQHAWNEPLEKVKQNSLGKNFRLCTPMIGEKMSLDDESQTFSEWWK
ncbi:MBL fold metallo-hydrolase [Epilithonimonas sp.]|uniref:MBL fold metallo-hydrolase n=1 Tax=Epilithonimonas sp. TaxID=2894511 RepID=UPI0028AEC449|nr:MBL fold metallo-hydrolase [Epilithonimonas sp.]